VVHRSLVIVLLGAVAGANFYFKKSEAVTINAEPVKKRDLEAIVTASGTIQAKRFVNISAVQMGRVTRLAVEEGDRVKAGQFLLEIDPNALRGTVERGEAAVAAARAGLAQARANIETAKANLPAGARPGEASARLVGPAADHEREPRSRGERSEGPRDGAAGARDRRELA
jgi:multidrug efflux pump subunit AcrA (membrane-fusion protein)